MGPLRGRMTDTDVQILVAVASGFLFGIGVAVGGFFGALIAIIAVAIGMAALLYDYL